MTDNQPQHPQHSQYNPPSNEGNQMNYITFNQQSTCLAISTNKGFQIYNTHPFKEIHSHPLPYALSKIAMLNRTNLLAFVGNASNPKHTQNKVIIYDASLQSDLCEFRFTTKVNNIQLTKDKIFVICETKIFLFDISSFENIDIIETYENKKGLIALSNRNGNTIIAHPGKLQGQITIKNIDSFRQDPIIINAHEAKLSCISLNRDGSLLCSASEKGTILRVFRTDDGRLVQELRRGSERAEIFSISFDMSSRFLACSSDRKTVHVFVLDGGNGSGEKVEELEETKVGNGMEEPKNQKSFLGKLSSLFGKGSYFNSEWSFAQFRIGDNENQALCSFSEKESNVLLIICNSGKFYEVVFDEKKGGECKKIAEGVVLVK